jgi:hypothetical protein
MPPLYLGFEVQSCHPVIHTALLPHVETHPKQCLILFALIPVDPAVPSNILQKRVDKYLTCSVEQLFAVKALSALKKGAFISAALCKHFPIQHSREQDCASSDLLR